LTSQQEKTRFFLAFSPYVGEISVPALEPSPAQNVPGDVLPQKMGMMRDDHELFRMSEFCGGFFSSP